MKKIDPDTLARRGLAALVTERRTVWQHPAFPVREVRAAAVRCGDVLADAVTGEALTVVGVGWSVGAAVVLYVREDNAQAPGATRKLHRSAREYVLRATDPAQPRAAHPGHERTTHHE